MSNSFEHQPSVRTNYEVKRKGKSNVRSRNDVIEVTQRNTMLSGEYSHIESFNGMEVVSDSRR